MVSDSSPGDDQPLRHAGGVHVRLRATPAPAAVPPPAPAAAADVQRGESGLGGCAGAVPAGAGFLRVHGKHNQRGPVPVRRRRPRRGR